METISRISYSISFPGIEVKLIDLRSCSLPFKKIGMTFVFHPVSGAFPSFHFFLSKSIERSHNSISQFPQHSQVQPIRPHGLAYIKFNNIEMFPNLIFH